MNGEILIKINKIINEFEKEIIQEFENCLKEKYVPEITIQHCWEGVFSNNNEYWSVSENYFSVGNSELWIQQYKNIIEITINGNTQKIEIENKEELEELEQKLSEKIEELENKIYDLYWQCLEKLVQKYIDPEAFINYDTWDSWIQFKINNKVYKFYPKLSENEFHSAGKHFNYYSYSKVTLKDILENAEIEDENE